MVDGVCLHCERLRFTRSGLCERCEDELMLDEDYFREGYEYDEY